jgi:hypothetical protein
LVETTCLFEGGHKALPYRGILGECGRVKTRPYRGFEGGHKALPYRGFYKLRKWGVKEEEEYD